MSLASAKPDLSADFPGMLADGIEAMGIAVTPAQQALMLRFIALLSRWNSAYNLTAVRSPRDMLIVHLLDSLSILPLIEPLQPQVMLDVGSGAGLPGIPLAIARASIEIHSIDAVNKKIGFQLQAKLELGLRHLHPRHARIETCVLPRPAVIVSRAYTDIATMLESIEHLADTSTTVIAMKGAAPVAEIAAVPKSWAVQEVRELEVPYLGAQRCAVVLQRATHQP